MMSPLTETELKQLKARFGPAGLTALSRFKSPEEARRFLKRASQPNTIGCTEETEDFGNGRGRVVVYWEKVCCYCQARYRSTDRSSRYCQPNHRQYFYRKKKEAERFLEVVAYLQALRGEDRPA